MTKGFGDRVLRDSFTLRLCETVPWDKLLHTLLRDFTFLDSSQKGSRKRQVMSPTMAPVPERPFTFSSLLRSQHLLLLLVLGLFTGTMIVPLLSSILLARFSNRLSRAEPLFTTALCTHHTTTYYRVNFAAASMHNLMITMMTSILVSVPPRVYPPPRDDCVPSRAGGSHMAGGSRESHLTIKQTGDIHLLVLPLLLTLQFPHSLSQQFASINSIYWTDFGSICSIDWWYWCCLRWFLRLLSGLLAKCSRLPLPVPSGERMTLPEKFSLSEVCAHNLDRREWRKMSHLDSMGLTVPTLPIICPFRLYRGCGFPFLALNWVTSCHLPLGFPFSAMNCVFHCRASAGCLLGLLYLLTWWCGISLFHWVFLPLLCLRLLRLPLDKLD